MNKRSKWLWISVLLILFTAVSVFAEVGTFQTDPDAIGKAVESVLMLYTYDRWDDEYATGSGFIMFDDQTLITNYHMLEDAERIVAESDNGTFYPVTRVLIASEDKDIAVLRLESPTSMSPLTPAGKDPRRGEPVIAIGSPKGMKNTVSNGIVSSVFTEDGVQNIQFTASISHGSSGGALFNSFGEVIGITSSSLAAEDAHDINFAVNISEVVRLYELWDGLSSYAIGDYASARYRMPASTSVPAPTRKPAPSSTQTPAQTVPPSGAVKPATMFYAIRDSVRINVGSHFDLFETVVILPKEAEQQLLLWKSSDPDIADAPAGMLIARSAGDCTVTATTTDGTNRSITFSITVIP